MLFADLLSLHNVTFLMFFILVSVFSFLAFELLPNILHHGFLYWILYPL